MKPKEKEQSPTYEPGSPIYEAALLGITNPLKEHRHDKELAETQLRWKNRYQMWDKTMSKEKKETLS